MAWVGLFPLDELSEGDMRQVDSVPGADLVVCHADGQVFVLDNECPHAGGPLAMGNFAPPFIACPWHAWEFDCRSGECAHQPATRLHTYPVEIRDGKVWALLPQPSEDERPGGD
jgi:nitrite reductase (NADH) small subunit